VASAVAGATTPEIWLLERRHGTRIPGQRAKQSRLRPARPPV
jgi:hypothetical protein